MENDLPTASPEPGNPLPGDALVLDQASPLEDNLSDCQLALQADSPCDLDGASAPHGEIPNNSGLPEQELAQPKKWRRKIFLVCTALTVLIGCLGALSVSMIDNHVIAAGVRITGIDVSHLTQSEAKELVAQEAERILASTLEFLIDGQTVQTSWRDLGLIITSDQALAQAYQVGREGDLWSRLLIRFSRGPAVNLDLTFSWDEQRLTNTLALTLAGFNRPPIDATFQITDTNQMKILPEQPGRSIDIPSLAIQIQNLKITPETKLNIPWQNSPAQLTQLELEAQKITGLVSTYSTKFDPNLRNRTENIRLAAQALDGTLIQPGAAFSFNETVGQRTYEAGYQDAMIIANGKFVPGLGGGVCQVSSTLYNAVLLANLPIVERSNHALAVSYVPLGQDATVAYPELDLKFRNTEGYLLIKTNLQRDTLTIDLYGQKVPSRTISITNDIESVLPFQVKYQTDPELLPGESKIIQKGQPGYVVKTWRTVKVNQEIIEHESLGYSRYQSLARLVAVAP